MRTWMVEVVITTPEMLVTDDFKELAAIEWEILVVDEAHRKKFVLVLLACLLQRSYLHRVLIIVSFLLLPRRAEKSQLKTGEEST